MAKSVEQPTVEFMDIPVTQPVIRPGGGVSMDRVQLAELFCVVIKYLGKRYKIVVKDGFTIDGASIPRVFWVVIGHPLTPAYVPGAIIHDGMYASEILDRATADKFFHAILGYCKVRNWKSDVMFRAVEMFGGLTWKRHTTQSVEEARKFVAVEVTDA